MSNFVFNAIFIHSIFFSFNHFFIQSFIHSIFFSFNNFFTQSFIHSIFFSFNHFFIQSFFHSIFFSFNLFFIQSFFHSIIFSFNHFFIQSFFHSIIYSFNLFFFIRHNILRWPITAAKRKKLTPKRKSLTPKKKKAKVIPIHKGGDSKPENYRPISTPPILFKMLERAVKTQLLFFLETNKLLIDSQSGYRQQHSTKLS